MKPSTPDTPALPLTLADLRGLAGLGVDATIGLTRLVEQMHLTIASHAPPLGGALEGPTRGITGAVYGTIRGVTRLIGRGVDVSLKLVEPAAVPAPHSRRRAALVAALNGIWGDHLHASGNPLAITMALRRAGHVLPLDAPGLRAALPEASGRVALLVHGLCMNDLQWQRHGHDHGRLLADELGCTVLALHYNSGLHISDNGEQLAALLERLAANWPVPLRELVIVGHSMGGLVARSAIHAAETRALDWRRHSSRLVCLGTPHHGAVLERGGHLLDIVLGLSPYVVPFARLGKARSAGITDLRYGNLQHADWQDRPAHEQKCDDRKPTPLPEGVAVYLLAATTAEQPRGLRHAAVGDGLVSLASAWGEHPERAHALVLPASHKRLITQANHWDLLSRPEAAQALRDWLA
ncbi:MAG TPA: alpha/beta hydrolase [Rubrivivax sp.]|nr:alpha/beta hydrolase [Rubrivivax sp.]HPO17633.1 alpha/beta hydrolase [Rubrivivax sp.]